MMPSEPRSGIGVSVVCRHARRARTSSTRAAAHAMAARGASRRPLPRISGRSAPTSSRERCSPPTGWACSRCRSGRSSAGSLRRGAAWSRSSRSRRHGRSDARARRYEIRVDTAFADGHRRLCQAGRADELDRRQRGCGVRPPARARLGALGRGVGRRKGSPAASTVSRSGASSPPSPCSTRGRTPRRPPSSASSSTSAPRATRIGACSTCSGSRPTSPPSAPQRSGDAEYRRRLADALPLPSAFVALRQDRRPMSFERPITNSSRTSPIPTTDTRS